MSATPLADSINALTTYVNEITGESDTTLSEAVATLAAGYGSASGGITTELIGSYTAYLNEYTDTSTEENTDTNINISNTKYVYIIATVYCDGTVDTSSSNNWGGLTVILGSRYASNNAYLSVGAVWQKLTRVLSAEGGTMPANQGTLSYGVWFSNNKNTAVLCRKAHATACPKLMAGNYTVKVYGITAI